MNNRPTNQQLCDDFRKLLTERFSVNGPIYPGAMTGEQLREETLRITKPWRGELWKAFAEIERRMCPQPENFK